MAESSQEMEAREKKELVSKEEKTVPARYFVPSTDIHETDDVLIVVMEVPGVEKNDIAVDLLIPASIRACSRFIPNTMSVTSRGRSPFRTKSTSSRSAPSWRTAC